MPCELIHDTLTIEIGLLEASFGPEWNCYPLPALQITGQSDTVEFRTIVLQNEFIEATFCLDLGGRLIRLFDKRTGTAAIELPKSLIPVTDDFRGAKLDCGVKFLSFKNELASVLFDELEPEDESDPAELLLFAINPWDGTDASVRIRLAPGEPFLSVETAINNRDLTPAKMVSGVSLTNGAPGYFGDVATLIQGGRGVAIEFETGAIDAVSVGQVSRESSLAGLSRDRFVLRIHPVSALGDAPVMQSGIQCGVRNSEFRWICATNHGNAKILAGLADGRTVESQIQLNCVEVGAIDLTGLGSTVKHVVIRSQSGTVLLDQTMHPAPIGTIVLQPDNPEALPGNAVWAMRVTSCRAAACVCLAREQIAKEDWTQADFYLEDALLYAGDHPLIWWAKAAVQRNMADGEAERPELMNAHYLSPLDPLLRAEAFLANPENSPAPSPLMAVIAADPMIALEVVGQYASTGFTRDAVRLLDELARHKSVPLLGYIHAYLMSKQGRMEVDVAQIVQQFESAPVEPPFPHRQLEVAATTHLAEKFSGSTRLANLVSVLRDRMSE